MVLLTNFIESPGLVWLNTLVYVVLTPMKGKRKKTQQRWEAEGVVDYGSEKKRAGGRVSRDNEEREKLKIEV